MVPCWKWGKPPLPFPKPFAMPLPPMPRIVEPEWLDKLPPTDGRAVRSRKDLQRINFWMGHAPMATRAFQTAFPRKPPRQLVDLGAGDGTWMLRLAKGLSSAWPAVTVLLVDRQPAISESTAEGFRALGWEVKIIPADVFDWLPKAAPTNGIIANLFLHHFENERLGQLLSLCAEKTQVFIACEPRRSRLAMLGSCCLGALGANPVSRHDAPVSVRAGFRQTELSALWPQKEWHLVEKSSGVFSHLFSATLKAGKEK